MMWLAAGPVSEGGSIAGVVTDSATREPLPDSIVILQCACLPTAREARTNSRGIYAFTDLPTGNYTVQVLAGKAMASKIFGLPRDTKLKANFGVDPNREMATVTLVELPRASAMDEATPMPVVADSSRDFTAVVDLIPTASRDFTAVVDLVPTASRDFTVVVDLSPAFDFTYLERSLFYDGSNELFSGAMGSYGKPIIDEWFAPYCFCAICCD
jgi:hypothetical protein